MFRNISTEISLILPLLPADGYHHPAPVLPLVGSLSAVYKVTAIETQ